MPAAQRRYWGYHELAEPWGRRLVEGAGVQPGDLVLDVGAGTGVITAHLLAAGARVIAFELHPGRARGLRSRFLGQPVKVVSADGADLRLPTRPFRVVANPPFGISTALLRRLLSPSSRLLSSDLVVPVQVAARWAGGRGPATRRWSRTFSARVVTRLPAGAFRPPAPIQAVVLRIERHGQSGPDPHAPPGPTSTVLRLTSARTSATGSGYPGTQEPRQPWKGILDL